jgi:hypothetical protein
MQGFLATDETQRGLTAAAKISQKDAKIAKRTKFSSFANFAPFCSNILRCAKVLIVSGMD